MRRQCRGPWKDQKHAGLVGAQCSFVCFFSQREIRSEYVDITSILQVQPGARRRLKSHSLGYRKSARAEMPLGLYEFDIPFRRRNRLLLEEELRANDKAGNFCLLSWGYF